MVAAGAYIGTVDIGFPIACGAETSGGGDTGVLVMGGTTLIGLCGLGRTTGGASLVTVGAFGWVLAVVGLAMVMFRVLLALAGVGVPGAGAGAGDGVEAGTVTVGTGAVGLLGWPVAEGAAGCAGGALDGAMVLVVAGFRGTVMEDVTTVGADGSVFTTTAPEDLGDSVKKCTLEVLDINKRIALNKMKACIII